MGIRSRKVDNTYLYQGNAFGIERQGRASATKDIYTFISMGYPGASWLYGY